MPYEAQNGFDIVPLLQGTALFLWKDWPRDMKLSNNNQREFTLSGTCPHCGREAAFPSVVEPFNQSLNEYQGSEGDRRISALRCIACREYILGIIKRNYSSNVQSY